jgi:hypothetical protein
MALFYKKTIMAFRLVVLVLSVSGVVMLGLSGAQFE